MISEYVQAALDEAEYDWMAESGEYFVAPPSIPGAWATGQTVEVARRELREVVEDMILISARTGSRMPRWPGSAPGETRPAVVAGRVCFENFRK